MVCLEKADLKFLLDSVVQQMRRRYKRDCSLVFDHAQQVLQFHDRDVKVQFTNHARLVEYASLLGDLGYPPILGTRGFHV